jgi:hypothetical protein
MDAHAERAGAAGAVEVLVAALRCDDALTQQHACDALHAIVTSFGNCVIRAVHAGVLEPLLGLLVMRSIPAETAACACSLLSLSLAVQPTLSQFACRLGAVEAVIAVMRTRAHEQAGLVVAPASGALHVLLVHDTPDATDCARRANAVPFLQDMLNAHGSEPDHFLRECLSILQDADAARCAAADAAMAALLAEEEAERSATGATAKSKGKTKSKKSKSKGGGASGRKQPTNDDDADADAAGAAPPPAPPAAPLDAGVDRAADSHDGGDATTGAAPLAPCAAAPMHAVPPPPPILPASAAPSQPPAAPPPSATAAPPAAPPPPRRQPPPYCPPSGAASQPPPPAGTRSFLPPPPASCGAAAAAAAAAAACAAQLDACLAGLELGDGGAAVHAVSFASPMPPPPPPPPPVMRECCVCLDDVTLEELRLLAPCGHRCVCGACADALCARPPQARLCPKCRVPITSACHVYDD